MGTSAPGTTTVITRGFLEFERRCSHTAFDDAAADRAVASALFELAGLRDEALFLEWANADRGILEEARDCRSAARKALLLVAKDNPGPILACVIAGSHIYILPQPATSGAAWCELECFTSTGELKWTGILHVIHNPPAERVRTLVAMFAEEAIAKKLEHPAVARCW